MTTKNKFKLIVIIIFLAIWGIFFINSAIILTKSAVNIYNKFFKSPSWVNKLYLILGEDFTKFIVFCEENIPEDEDIFFYDGFRPFDEVKDSFEGLPEQPGWAFLHKQYIRYFLYPRLVYTQPEHLNEREFSYIIVYGGSRTFDGFIPIVKYSEDKYILKRKDNVN